MLAPFRIEIPLLAPVILPAICPTLDVLLAEGARRRAQDWEATPDLPLQWDDEAGVFVASQAIFLDLPERALSAGEYTHATNLKSLELDCISDPRKTIQTTGGPTAPKFTSYQAIKAAAVVFYGVGHAGSVVQLLSYLGGIGVSRPSGMGEWSIEDLIIGESEAYREKAMMRSVSRSHASPEALPYTPIKTHRRLVPWAEDDVAAYAPPRLLKEKRP
jgi:hypothetical protein